MRGDPNNLFKNSFLYESCLEWVESVAGDPERCLAAIAETAAIARHFHPGRFADGALENHALRIGRAQLPAAHPIEHPQRLSRGGQSSTLHVATEIHAIGGHSRVLAKWGGRDRTATHTVVLTAQHTPVPAVVEHAISDVGGSIVALQPSETRMLRAAKLREFARRFDRVILHTHPNDVVPIVAFAQTGGPPVAMFNHAHFSFCLGPTIADVVVNTLDYFRALSERYRSARRTRRLTGVPGLVALRPDPIDKPAAKVCINLDPSLNVVLAIAQEPYFAAMPGYDFFATARRLLHQNPTMHLVVIGVRRQSGLVPADLRREERCHWIGPVVDPIPYYRAADVCLESFPMPSLGAICEAVAFGEAFPIPVYGRSEGILRVSQGPVLSYQFRPKDENDYVAYVTDVLSTLSSARDWAHQTRLQMLAIDGRWDDELRRLNTEIDRLAHEPAEIAHAAMIDSEDTRLLAALTPPQLSHQIEQVLPFAHAAWAHIRAVGRGLAPPRTLGRVLRHAWHDMRRQLGRS
jgi:hypothetical protein